MWTKCLAEGHNTWWLLGSNLLTQGHKMSDLIWIQTVWHSDGIPGRFFFEKVDFKKKIHRRQKSMQNFPACKEIKQIPSPVGEPRASLIGSVGCAVQLETRRSRVQPPPRSATFFRGDWSWNIFYGHSLPLADSIRAVNCCQFLAKECAQYWLTA